MEKGHASSRPALSPAAETSEGSSAGETRLRTLAPIFLVACALTRSYLEMAVLARGDHFSYYTALHHLCWYTSLMLAILLTAHVILRVPVARLLWLMYGIVLTVIPLLFAILTGKPLAMEYLVGPWREVITHVLTFYVSYERNWPLVLEVVLIFVGMLGVGWVYSRSWRRALLLAVAVHLVTAIVGQAWFSPRAGDAALIAVPSRLFRTQALQAACWVAVATLLTLALLWRAGALSRSRRSWAIAALAAGELWIAWTLTVLLTSWLPQTFDALVTGLPVATASFLVVRLLLPDRRLVPWHSSAALGALLVVQLLILGPVALHTENRLLRPIKYRIMQPRKVRSPRPTQPRAEKASPVPSSPAATSGVHP